MLPILLTALALAEPATDAPSDGGEAAGPAAVDAPEAPRPARSGPALPTARGGALVDAVVLITTGNAICAGAFVDDAGTVATAYHCVAAGGRPKVETRDGRETVGKVVAVRAGWDLAVIAAPELAGGAYLPLRLEHPEVGEPVWAVGHPYGATEQGGFMGGTLRWSVSQGIVSAVGERALQVTAPVNPGNSGGPIIDADGNLVAVVSRRISGDGLGFAGLADALQPLLDEPNGFPFTGGTIAVETLMSVWGGAHGALAFGGRVEFAMRDRVVASIQAAAAPSARWDSVRFGEVVWSGAEARGGLRQRLFSGVFTTRVDVFGGAAVIEHLYGTPELSLRRVSEVAPLVGGAVSIGATGVDVSFVQTAEGWTARTQLTWGWPGTLWIF